LPGRTLRLLLRRPVRWAVAWALTLSATGYAIHEARYYEEDPRRGDHNGGHCTIDFGGQYLMGRMMATGNGRRLYNRKLHRQILEEAYPRADGKPEGKGDAAALISWMMDDPQNPDLGGPLYPPVHAMFYAPLGTLPPRQAYRVLQVVIGLLTYWCGWMISRVSGGRLWWPVATLGLMCLPGFPGAICLAQNPFLTLAILLAGWRHLQQDRPVRGGIVWGFLAFKPVWAAAFTLVPLLTRRWKFLAAMVATGVALGAVTLPFVGLQSWFDWLALGRVAAVGYTNQESWIILSRDLSGVFRRWMLTFDHGFAGGYCDVCQYPGQVLPTLLGWALWWSVLGVTVQLAVVRQRHLRALTGPGAACLLLGAYFACYHFMYYDVIVSAFPLAVLFADPGRFLEVRFWPRPRTPLPAALVDYYRPTWDRPQPPPVPLLAGGREVRWVRNPLPVLIGAFLLISTPVCIMLDDTFHFPPMDTFSLLAFWAWCVVWVIRGGPWPQSRKEPS
jgi:hypothetical protein